MKKKLLFISLLTFGALNAQITDDLESYTLGPVHSGPWTSWSGNAGAEDGIITNFRALSGTQSLFIGNSGQQDCILDLALTAGAPGYISSGQWTVQFEMYIPSDSAGYYNFQETVPIAAGSWGLELYFGDTTSTNAGVNNGVGAIKATGASPVQFSFPNDTWFTLTHYIDVDNDNIDIHINGISIYNGSAYTSDFTGTTGGALAALDFFSASNSNSFYIDDVEFVAGYLSTKEISKSVELSVFPNPVSEVLNINAEQEITLITIYDMTGRVVKTINSNTKSLTVSTTDLTPGTYMVKVDMGEKSEIIKILK